MVVKAQTAQEFNICQVSSKSLTRLAETAVKQAQQSGFGRLPASRLVPSSEQPPILLCWPRCDGA